MAGNQSDATAPPASFVWLSRSIAVIGAAWIFFQVPPDGLSVSAQRLAAVTFLMAVLWMSEAAPVILTSILPLALFPLLEVAPISKVAPAYIKDLIWLFFGGFQLAFAVERCGLHKRMAMAVLRTVGSRSDRVVLGFMLASGLLSMWLFNTSTTLMLLPVAMAVVKQLDPDRKSFLGEACMLGLAYAASIGGTGTYLGTAPNGVFREQATTFGTEISFANWMLFAMPLALIMIVVVWLFLVRVALPVRGTSNASVDFDDGLSKHWTIGEKRVLVFFVITVTLWLTRGYISAFFELEKGMLTDGRIALVSTLLLYLTPGGLNGERLLTVAEGKRTPWAILVLFGGGFAIAEGFKSSGLSFWVGESMKGWVSGWPIYAVILVVVLLVTFLTEITSNTATANVLLPVIGSLAVATDTPVVLLMLPATLAASCAFMMPVATPPNAIVYGSRMVSLKRMSTVGFGVNLLTGLMITLWTLTWGKLVLPIP